MVDKHKLIEELKRELNLRQSIGAIPTELDFLSTCETINNLLAEHNQTPISPDILKQWGIKGGEGMNEIAQMLDEWLAHVDSRGKDEV
jgi:hypothetical protein